MTSLERERAFYEERRRRGESPTKLRDELGRRTAEHKRLEKKVLVIGAIGLAGFLLSRLLR